MNFRYFTTDYSARNRAVILKAGGVKELLTLLPTSTLELLLTSAASALWGCSKYGMMAMHLRTDDPENAARKKFTVSTELKYSRNGLPGPLTT